MQVRIRRGDCCGHAQCVEIAPAVFRIDSHNKSVVLDSEGASLQILIVAAEACPCTAIEIEDDEGNPLFP
jgi:ferredoxin